MPSEDSGAVDNQPESIKAVLRESARGHPMLVRMFDDGCSCILADEMGLGKTLQSISFLACLKELAASADHIWSSASLSCRRGWTSCRSGARTFASSDCTPRTGGASAAAQGGGAKRRRPRHRRDGVRDGVQPRVQLGGYREGVLAHDDLDEGHKVKNEGTAAHSVLSRVHRQHTLLLTGTPVQNNLHGRHPRVSAPRCLHQQPHSTSAFDLGTKEHKVDSQTLDHAHYLMKPFVLRRVKGSGVSLPEKTETKIMCRCRSRRFGTAF